LGFDLKSREQASLDSFLDRLESLSAVIIFEEPLLSRVQSLGDSGLEDHVLAEELYLSPEVSLDDIPNHADMPQVVALV
jgi:hypothetical protein